MSVIIKDDRLNFDELTRALKDANREIVAGIQAGAVKDGLQVAEYATFNEFGTSKIPARPFMRGYIDNNLAQLTGFCRNGVTQITLGNTDFTTFANAVGLEMVNGIKKSITSGDWIPNAPETIKRKKSAKPLIDTARMLNSVTYAVRRLGETKE